MLDSSFFHKLLSKKRFLMNRIEKRTDRSMNFQTSLKKGVFHLTRSQSDPS
ncbi:polysaccharide deacetylase [Leptospira santarosai serovar Bananal]|uniref:Polysaccharide deacetylase n=1 Tax=Leptospira santarosai TaxID=28183 RepID=A0AB73MDY9_9LEPT|nr:polysaccharide deacetylase [Leptospira santarosai]OLY60627.1 polysaccharide deacetylase [Leptospira santarosai serovar Guaricura]OLY64326.1 polysaccharide deacetylase [Leptospira santarosai serovar Grippotyphosa]ONF79934.1 polysaccharide deacetylase [Leptospira santarosai serovar Bananal]ONF86443.1 polysaccharide deacetylase [Leptospira santarosai serovar Grippotyphosa]